MSASVIPTPEDVDTHVGERIRLRRKALGLSQTLLGQAIGVSFQQVQKYERGVNRVSVSALFGLAAALQVDHAWFFEGLPGRPVTDPVAGLSDTVDGRRLAEAFAGIEAPVHRELVIKLARELRSVRAKALEAA